MRGAWADSAAKRLFDLALALPMLAVALPFVIMLTLALRISASGSAIFSQARVGRSERPFLCRKLRTMRVGTPSVATHDAPKDAVTPLGKILRRFKLDELPQLWNVVTGEMSLVGPRPCLPTQAELVQWRRALGVFALRPGITGLAQVRGIDMSTPEACARADAEYAATASPLLDVRLLLRTVFPVRSRPASQAGGRD